MIMMNSLQAMGRPACFLIPSRTEALAYFQLLLLNRFFALTA